MKRRRRVEACLAAWRTQSVTTPLQTSQKGNRRSIRATNGTWEAFTALVTCVQTVLREAALAADATTVPQLLNQRIVNEAYQRFNAQQRTTAAATNTSLPPS